MPDPETTVLDHTDNIVVPGNVFTKPANEYWALVCLWDGMEFLYRQVSQSDEVVRKRLNPDGNVQFIGVGNVTATVRRGGDVSTSDAIKPWSLCRVHEKLRERYWPASSMAGHRQKEDQSRPECQ